MPQDPTHRPPEPAPTPTEKDAGQEIGGRQPQRPGQDGKHQPRPGERDPGTLSPEDPNRLRRS